MSDKTPFDNAIEKFNDSGLNIALQDKGDTMNFKCLRCGKCCKENTRIMPVDIFYISRHLNMEPSEFLNTMCEAQMSASGQLSFALRCDKNNNCVFLETDPITFEKSCKIYDCMPLICRTYPLGTIYEYTVDDGAADFKERLILTDDCDGYEEGNDLDVHQYFHDKSIGISYEERRMSRKLMIIMTHTFQTIYPAKVLPFILTAFDLIKGGEEYRTVSKMLAYASFITETSVLSIAYIEWDTNSKFIPQAKRMYEQIDDICKKFEETFGDMINKISAKADLDNEKYKDIYNNLEGYIYEALICDEGYDEKVAKKKSIEVTKKSIDLVKEWTVEHAKETYL